MLGIVMHFDAFQEMVPQTLESAEDLADLDTRQCHQLQSWRERLEEMRALEDLEEGRRELPLRVCQDRSRE